MNRSIPAQSLREETILEQAIGLESDEARRAYLEKACGQDPELRARLELLVAAHRQAGDFLSPVPRSDHDLLGLGEVWRPEARVGPYRLREKIGEGGCGVVYVAEQELPLRRVVALKLIKLGMDTRQVVARFDAERQALARMDHPNIAKVLDGGATDSGRPYFVMELVRGVRITDYCEENQLSLRARLELFIQVCRAVQHAHQKGIVHRDLKPSNILVSARDGVPAAKVIDFGIAKAIEGRLTDLTICTSLHPFVGTPAYMSPEQAESTGLDIDTRSDIYSLGVLLYELITGKTPFDSQELLSQGLDAMRKTIREIEPARPSAKLHQTRPGRIADVSRGSLDPDLDWIAMKALEKDRSRRYETANGLAADVERYLNQEAVLARPSSRLYRLQKLIRRNKLAVAAATAIGIALVLGIATSTWQALRATQREAAAQHLLYIANMNLAEQAWEQNNLDRLRQLLVDTERSPDRGFEWFFWQPQTRLASKTLRGLGGKVWAMDISSDGSRLVTAASDGTAKVWNTATGQKLFTMKHGGAAESIALSSDGQRIVTGSWDKTVCLWDGATGRLLTQFPTQAVDILHVAISRDGQRLATSYGARDLEHRVKIWDLQTGHELPGLVGHTELITTIDFAPDGQRILTASRDRTFRIWEARTGRSLFVKEHTRPINGAAFSPDGRRVAIASNDGQALVFDVATNQCLAVLKGHASAVNSARFSGDGELIVTASQDGTARVWQAATGEELFTLKGHGSSLSDARFLPHSNLLVTSSTDSTTRLWDPSAGITAGETGRPALILRGHTNSVWTAAFSPDGRSILTAADDQSVRVWDSLTGRPRCSLTGPTNAIRSATWSPDSRRIVAGSMDWTARVWDASSGETIWVLQGHTKPIVSVAYSPNGKLIATGSWDRTARIWDAQTGALLYGLPADTQAVYHVTFSPDSTRLITSFSRGGAKLWDAANGKQLGLFSVDPSIRSSSFSPGGRWVISSLADHTARVWAADTGQERLTLTGHCDALWAASFSPDSKRLLTCSLDGTAKLWDPVSGRELLTLKGHSESVHAADFSPDGLRIVTGSADGTARVWAAARPEQVTTWEADEKAVMEAGTAP